ncbi:MAG: hypothetical protein V4772_26455 [Pseudomonadota bacterium]
MYTSRFPISDSFCRPFSHWAARLRAARLSVLLGSALLLSACVGGGGDDPVPPVSVGKNTLSVSVAGNGSVSSQPAGISCGTSCTADFAADRSITLTASPATGQVFKSWGGDCAGATPTCTLTMQTGRTVTASFNALAPAAFTLGVSVTGSGSLRSQPAGIDCGSSCQAGFAANTSVVLSATPATGQVQTGWGGACAGAGQTCTVLMSQARSASASFAPVPVVLRTLNVTLAGSGLVRSQPLGIDCGSACSASFGERSNIVLTAAPAAGQQFSNWTGACSGTAPTCALTMNTNLIVGATFAVATSAPVWQTPQLLESNNDFNVATRILTATSPNGNVFVMWEQSDGSPSGDTIKVFSRRYVAGTGWDAAVAVAGVSTTSSSVRLLEGKLLMDAAGTATWLRPNLETRRFTVGSGWSTPFVPPALAAGLMTDAVMDASGAIGVVTSGSDVYNITLAAGATSWLPWARVDASGSLDAKDASVAISADGTAMAIWRERNPGDTNYSIRAARFSNGWQTPQTIDNSFDNVSIDSQSRIAMDAAGNAIAVWHQGDSLYYNVFSPASGWGTAVEVDANAVESVFSAHISLRMTASGRAVVIWNSGIFGVKSMQYTPGSGFSAPVLVNAYGADSQLGLDADGNATVVYVAPDKWPNPSTGSDLYSRRLPWGGAWSDAVAIEPKDGLGINTAEAAFNSVGQGVATWVRGDVAGNSARKSLWVNVLR